MTVKHISPATARTFFVRHIAIGDLPKVKAWYFVRNFDRRQPRYRCWFQATVNGEPVAIAGL